MDLFDKIGIEIPSEVADIRPQSMQPLVMDRAIYISIKDGSETGFRILHQPTQIDQKALRRRYKNIVSWRDLNKAKTFPEACDVYFKIARGMMIRDNHHRSFAMLFKGVAMLTIVAMDHPDRASRYVIVRELAALAKIVGADGVMLIAEAWTAPAEDLPPSGYAAEAKNRGEALVMSAASSDGKCYHYQAQIERKKIKKHKVKRILPTEFIEDEFEFILSPFQKEWGCLKMSEVKKSLALMDEMGLDPAFDTMPTEPVSGDKDLSDVGGSQR